MRSLMWFRSDLRVRDNTALVAACRDRGGCVGLFVISPGEWRAHDVAPVRIEFMLRTLAELSVSLAKLNIPLLIAQAARPADVPATALRIAKENGCERLYFNREYEVNESRRDAAVTALFQSEHLAVDSHDDQSILAPGRVRTQEGRAFTVFTPFKKRWLAALEEEGGHPPLGLPAKQPETGIAPSHIPEQLKGFTSRIPAETWPAGERAAQTRLDRFCKDHIDAYKAERDLPALDSTSTLSPYLAVGSISPRHCLAAAREANSNEADGGKLGPATWISELIWREFYIHVMQAFPRICMHRAFKPETERLRWSDSDEHFAAWCEGRTGVPIVDAAMRQLVQTGWMHNRLRMITAMFLTKDLFIDWRRGEKFFMQNLVDGFLASNNGGWQWSASTGTDAAPYFRIFNPFSQSRTCDPRGTFIRRYCPELAHLTDDEIHEPHSDKTGVPPLARATLDYPPPLTDHRTARDRVMKAFSALRTA